MGVNEREIESVIGIIREQQEEREEEKESDRKKERAREREKGNKR